MKNNMIVTLEGSGNSLQTLTSNGGFKPTPDFGYLMSLGSEKSRTVMKSYLNTISGFLGYDNASSVNWSGIDRYEVMNIQEILVRRDASINTIKVYMSALKGVMNEAWIQGVIGAEQLQRIKSVKPPRGSKVAKGRRLSNFEVLELIKSCKGTKVSDCRDKAIISLLVECGLRRSEVASLKKKGFSESAGCLKIVGKGNKERVVYLPNLSKESLSAWLEGYTTDESDFIFNRVLKSDEVGIKPLTPQSILYILDKRKKQAGIDEFSPHDLRRTFATKLFEDGIDPLTIQKAMGHTNLSTTERYDKRGEDRVKEVASNFSYNS